MSTSAAAVTAWGLPTAHRLPTRPLDDEAFTELLRRCVLDRVLGLLGSAVRDGALPVTPLQRERLERDWQAWLAHAVRVERLVLDVLEGLGDEGIDAVVLKGVALAHTSYPDPSARVFGDVDLLVAPGRLHHAAAVLVDTRAGVRAEPELRPGFDDRFGREAMVRVGSIEVDLHRTFVNGAYGVRVDAASIFAEPHWILLAGRPVRVLGPTDRLLHAAYASTLSDWPPRLVASRDLAQVLLVDRPTASEVIARATEWRAEAVLASGIRAAWRTLRLTDRPALLDWAETHRGSMTDRVLLAAARGPARGYTGQLTSVLALPGLASRAAFLRAIALPSREYRDARQLGRFGLLGAGTRRARRG